VLKRYQFRDVDDGWGVADGWGCAHFAAIEGNQAILEALMDEGIAIDAPACGSAPSVGSSAGMTPLMAAATYIPDPAANMKACSMLLRLGASIHTQGAVGQTVVHCAAAAPAGATLLARLLEQRADSMVRDHTGETPLHYACMATSTTSAGRVEQIRCLLAHGASCNAVGGAFEASPLHWVAAGGADEVKAILDARANPNVQMPPSKSRDVLRDAYLQQSRVSVASVLASHGSGFTPIMMSAWMGNCEIVELLLARRADPHLRTATRRQAIDWLEEHGIVSGRTHQVLQMAAGHALVPPRAPKDKVVATEQHVVNC